LWILTLLFLSGDSYLPEDEDEDELLIGSTENVIGV